MERKIYCVGMRVEEFVDKGPGEESYDMVSISNERYKLCCVEKINEHMARKFIIELHTSYDWCGSGYCGASFGEMYIERTNDFGPITHKPKGGNIEITGLEDYLDDKGDGDPVVFVDTNLFTYSAIGEDCGGDEYYPYGYVKVHADLFEELPRAMKKRPVWVFYGDSGLGKSTLGYYLKGDYTVYETDSSENLPEEIWADIIVIGNKWGHTVENVMDRIAEKDNCNIIPVKFG